MRPSRAVCALAALSSAICGAIEVLTTGGVQEFGIPLPIVHNGDVS
jgi:hypothetical protein